MNLCQVQYIMQLYSNAEVVRSSKAGLSKHKGHFFKSMAVFGVLLSWLSQALLLAAIVLFVAFLGYCLYIKHLHLKYDHIPGPPRKR